MCPDSPPSADTARLLAARNEALRRAAEHAVAAQLRRSRWCAIPRAGAGRKTASVRPNPAGPAGKSLDA